MAYSELVKNFEKIRDYMREFYVFGFKTREEYDKKSARSYDNERRRVESWLGEFMAFKRDSAGKSVFLSVDNRSIRHNPLHKAFKAKSFTDKDITLHFYLLDILQPGVKLSTREIIDRIQLEYSMRVEEPIDFDDSTIRKKLKEYEELGLFKSEKAGRELLYSRTGDSVDLESWQEAAAFYSEADPMGVVGSFILDKYDEEINHYNFKHHYILHTLDSQILLMILQGIRERKMLELTMLPVHKEEETIHKVCPLKVMISTQTGRQYVLCYGYKHKRAMVLRMDNIHSVKPGNKEKHYGRCKAIGEEFQKNLWGVSSGNERSLDHLEMTVHIEPNEYYIVDRLEREKRCGYLEKIDDGTYKFTADVYDASEMLIWIRTFIGRVEKLECSNSFVVKRFYDDVSRLQAMYGGGDNGVQ